MKNNFIKQGYHSSLINEHLERISLLNRIDLITEKERQKKSDKYLLQLRINDFYRLSPKPLKRIETSYR